MEIRVLVPLADGFEEIEAVAPVDLLRRAGAQVTLASVSDSPEVIGKTGMALRADAGLADLAEVNFDALVLPGGPAARELRERDDILNLVRSFHEADKWMGAICAAPVILERAGVLNGRKRTGHFSVAEELGGVADEAVVRDGKIITSQGAGTAIAFGLALIEALFSAEQAREIARSVCA